MQNFSLINFINKKEKITESSAELIVKALLKPHAFSKKATEKISFWYQTLPINEKKYLYTDKSFKKILTQISPFFEPKIEISSFWLTELFKNSKYKISPKQIKELSAKFQFTKVTLPSNVEIYVDPEMFFKTLIQGINNHPHLIDEFKNFLNKHKEPIFITPENGDLIEKRFLGLFDADKNSIYFKGDLVHYNTLGTLIHEIGHATDSKKINPFFKKTSLAIYYDEITQEAKSTLIETREFDTKAGEMNPFESLYFYIENQLKEKYPSLNKEKIERAAAFWFKNEFISASSLSKNQLINLLNLWHSNGIKFTDQIFQQIEHLKKQYTHPEDITNSYKNISNDIASFLLKQLKHPFYFSKKMMIQNENFIPFSNDLLNELSTHAGYVEKDENLLNFKMQYCSLEQENNEEIILSFNLNSFDEKSILKTQDFYTKRGVFLTKKGKYLITTHPESIERMTRIIQHFFDRTLFLDEEMVYHFQNNSLFPWKEKQLINLLKKTKIPFYNIQKDIFIQTDNLNNQKLSSLARKKLLVTAYPFFNTESNLTKIFQALSLNPKIYMQSDEDKIYLLFSSQDFVTYKKISRLIRNAFEINQYYNDSPSNVRDVFVPNRLLVKKNKLLNNLNQKKLQREKN